MTNLQQLQVELGKKYVGSELNGYEKLVFDDLVDIVVNELDSYDLEETIKDYLAGGIDELTLVDEIQEKADNALTGNIDGSYTYNRKEAFQILQDNNGFYNLTDMVEIGLIDYKTIVKLVADENWELLDVLNREFALDKAIGELCNYLDEFKD